MNVEGRGNVPPGRIFIRLSRQELAIIKNDACDLVIYRDYQRRADAWGRGIVGEWKLPGGQVIRDGAPPMFLGKVGEHGVCSFINRRFKRTLVSYDAKRRPWGDGGRDLSVYGLSIQIKVRHSHPGTNLDRRVDDRGRFRPVMPGAYVFCEFEREKQDGVWLLGWAWSKAVNSAPQAVAPAGHVNSVLLDESLLPMSRLIDELRRRELEAA